MKISPERNRGDTPYLNEMQTFIILLVWLAGALLQSGNDFQSLIDTTCSLVSPESAPRKNETLNAHVNCSPRAHGSSSGLK